MKNSRSLSIFLMLFVLISTTSFAANPPADMLNLNGPSNTWLGDYQIKELSPVTQNGQTLRTFELTYANAEKSVMIYLDERANCIDYIVRSKNLEVRYICGKSTFGAALVSGKFRQYDQRVNANFLAYDEFLKQQKISEGLLEIPSALGLIASYYPGLLKTKNLLD